MMPALTKKKYDSDKVDIDNVKTWSEIIRVSPIELGRVYYYGKNFESILGTKVNKFTSQNTRRRLLDARNNLDLMMTTLIQVLYDSEVMKTPEDRVLFAWLKDDLGRYLQSLDDSEESANRRIVEYTGIPAHTKKLINGYRAIFEALIKSVKEYYLFEETEDIKRDKRTFLYILFQVIQITMSMLGSITREAGKALGRRGLVNNYPQTWQQLMSTDGSNRIREGYKKETGRELEIPQSFMESTQDDADNFGGDLDEN